MNTKQPKLWTLFEDCSGGYSMMRAVFAFTTILILGMWAFNCYTTKVLQPLPHDGVMLIIGLSGVKAFQRFGEKTDEEPTVPAATPAPAPVVPPPVVEPPK